MSLLNFSVSILLLSIKDRNRFKNEECLFLKHKYVRKGAMIPSDFAVSSPESNNQSSCIASCAYFRRKLPGTSNITFTELPKNLKNNVLQSEYRIQFLPFLPRLSGTLRYSYGRLKPMLIRKNSFFFFCFFIILLICLMPSATAKNFKQRSSDSSRTSRRTEHFRRRSGGQCERITIPICVDIGYNFTDISLSPSNMLEQEEAATAVKQFKQIIDVNCAEEMKQLVCAIYTPICMNEYNQFLPPCRDICDRARKGCGPILEKYQVDWPELLQCETFPWFSDRPCLHFNKSKDVSANESEKPLTSTTNKAMKTKPLKPAHTRSIQFNLTQSTTVSNEDQCTCHCHHPMILLSDPQDPLYNQVEMGRTSNCVSPCKSPYFTREQLSILQSWITALSIICFIVTSLTVGTFLIDASRFKYPERSIIFLSLCYMFVSMGFLIRVAASHDAVACGWQSDHVQYPHTAVPFLCGLVYFLLYFFGMAGALWWVILSFTWLLASGLKWGSEAISKCSHRFHLVAWVIPIIQTLTVFGLWFVDGDAVSGICFVGNQDTNNAYYFVIVPLLLYLGLGSIFSLFGFFDLCRIRTSIKKAKKKTDSFDKMFGRMGFFSLMYMVFTSLLVACYFYELVNRDKWANTKNCRKSNSAASCSLDFGSSPDLSVFIVKYSMTLLIGITNGVWICSKKTIHSWRQFYKGSFIYVCGSGGFVRWFKRKKKEAGSKIFQSKISTPQSSEQTSVDLVPESSLSEMDQRNKSASSSIINEEASSRQDSKNYRDSSCSGLSLLPKEPHSKEVKRREKTSKHPFRKTCSCLEAPGLRKEGRVHLLNCMIPNEVQSRVPEFSRMISVVSAPGKRSSSGETENHYLHFPSKRLSKSTKECVVYCSHPVAMSNHLERSSPTAMSADNDGQIQHIHYHHHHHHHVPPKTGVFLHQLQHHQTCSQKCGKRSQSSSSSGCNRQSQSSTERNAFYPSNSLQRC